MGKKKTILTNLCGIVLISLSIFALLISFDKTKHGMELVVSFYFFSFYLMLLGIGIIAKKKWAWKLSFSLIFVHAVFGWYTRIFIDDPAIHHILVFIYYVFLIFYFIHPKVKEQFK